MPRKQVGARYLHKCKTRNDKTFTGIIKVANPRSIKLSSKALKRVRNA